MDNRILFRASQILRRLGMGFEGRDHPAILRMQREIHNIGSIQFKIEYYPDGSWTAESTNIDGIITGSRNVKDISFTLKDSVFTYFGVPPHLCNDNLLKGDNEPAAVAQRVYATN